MKTFKPYTPAQLLLLPPALQDWLPEGHLAQFISDVVDEALDLTPILATYKTGDGRGQPPYYPALMVKLHVYAYCTGKPSSRQIERATYEEVPYRCWRRISTPTTTPSPPSGSSTWGLWRGSSVRCSTSVGAPAW
jgi:transposase